MSALPPEVELAMALEEVAGWPEALQERFAALYRKSRNLRSAMMFAASGTAFARAPRQLGGDRVFCEQARRRMETMNEKQRTAIQRIAARAGIDTRGKFYVGGLGKYGDKAAWVTSAQDVKEVAKARDLNVSGTVRHDGGEVREYKVTPMGEDIQADFVRRYCAKDKALAKRVKAAPEALRKLKAEIVEKHANPGLLETAKRQKKEAKSRATKVVSTG